MTGAVQAALARMNDEDYEEYKWELRRAERHGRSSQRSELLDFERDDPGYPLGSGYPLGRTLRLDGESHRQAWMRVLRDDPCAFCGGLAGTVDHVEPSRGPRRARGIGGAHVWLNLSGACERCNANKSDETLVLFLARRSGVMVPKHPRTVSRHDEASGNDGRAPPFTSPVGPRRRPARQRPGRGRSAR